MIKYPASSRQNVKWKLNTIFSVFCLAFFWREDVGHLIIRFFKKKSPKHFLFNFLSLPNHGQKLTSGGQKESCRESEKSTYDQISSFGVHLYTQGVGIKHLFH